MINSVLQVQTFGFIDISIVFLFAFGIVGGSVYILLSMNKERWFNIRRIPYKKLLIDVPGNVIIKILPKAGESVEQKILGKKRTYLLPTSASKDGVVYHFDFDNSNPKVTPERKSWKAPPESWADKKKLPLFRDFYNSEEISRIISSKIFIEYQKAKVQVNANTILFILIAGTALISGYGVYQMSLFVEDFPTVLSDVLERVLGNGGE